MPQVVAINEWGPLVAKPGGDGVYTLVKLQVPSSRAVLLNLVQRLQVNTAGDQVKASIAGVTWQLQTRAEADKATAQKSIVRFIRSTEGTAVAFVDGTPLARNVFVRGPCEVLFELNVAAVGSIPAVITHFIGGLTGFEFPVEWENRGELLSLLSRP